MSIKPYKYGEYWKITVIWSPCYSAVNHHPIHHGQQVVPSQKENPISLLGQKEVRKINLSITGGTSHNNFTVEE
jgi:hypothetical protein